MCSAIKKLHAKFRLSFEKKKIIKKSISEMSVIFLKYSSGINTLFTTDTIVDFLPGMQLGSQKYLFMDTHCKYNITNPKRILICYPYFLLFSLPPTSQKIWK